MTDEQNWNQVVKITRQTDAPNQGEIRELYANFGDARRYAILWADDELTQLRATIEQQAKELAEAKREVDRLNRWESLVVADVEAGLRHFGDDQLADRFAESKSPIHQRLMMVFHCLTLAAEAAREKA